MAGTIIITGANSSLGIPAVEHLLSKYPEYNVILTVRNVSDSDLNTKRLRETIGRHKDAKADIRQLDLANLSAVHDFADTLVAEVVAGKQPPIASIIANAYYWNLTTDAVETGDGFETTFQVNYISHVALVLRLLGSFSPEGGRVVLLSSDAHWPGKNSLEKYTPTIPEDLDSLVKTPPATEKDKMGKGFQRYANSKLATVLWMHALNARLEKDAALSKITAVAINPGNLSDSRALRTNTPQMLHYLQKLVLQPLRPIMRLRDPTLRSCSEAGVDVIELATGRAGPGERGHFTLLKKDQSSAESNDKTKQDKLWKKSAEWAKITQESSALQGVLE